MFVNQLHNGLLQSGRALIQPGRYFSASSSNELIQSIRNRKEIIERTISEDDVKLFSKITGDFNPIHSNLDGKRGIVHGALLNGIVSGVIGIKLPGKGTIVLSQTLNFPKPCYIGDTVIVTVEIENVRKILMCKYQVVNKLCKSVVMYGGAKLLYRSGYNNET